MSNHRWIRTGQRVVLLLSIALTEANLLSAQERSADPGRAEVAVDEPRLRAAGIDVIVGQHLTLMTDDRDADSNADLVKAFDAAVNSWCRIFDRDPATAADWKMRGYLIADPTDPSRFQRAGLWPGDLPEFAAGYQRDRELWLYHQPGPYYTRHLLLHEGTHGFMQSFLDGYGAPWYSEGMAELLSVHRWREGELTLRHRLRDREDAPYWGRVRLIRDECRDGTGMTLEEVLRIPANAFRDVRYYAWSWAGCQFFSDHALTAAAFQRLASQAESSPAAFTQSFLRSIETHRSRLAEDWELFIGEIDYGYEVQRGRLSDAQPAGPDRWKIAVDRSWQRTDLEVQPGDRLDVSATGRYVVGKTVQGSQEFPWPCEPNGITLRYHRDQPLGRLELGILDDSATTARGRVAGLLDPLPVGNQAQIAVPRAGRICFRINDSPARMDDNQGDLEVTVKRLE